MNRFEFPIGYHSFHKNQLFNFQLNRWYSSGYVRLEDVKAAGCRIGTFKDWKTEMVRLADAALNEGRFLNAAFYYRAAEFYAFEGDSDKEFLYDKFIALFYDAVKDDHVERFEIPCSGAFLPATRLRPATATRGTIVMHGGFDSYIEEFYSWMRFFADRGYAVIAFEGPGQGAALRKHGLALDHEWEKPVKAVLDHFKLYDATLLGISMGGWFSLRAAAFEPRISRVIAMGTAIDYPRMMPSAVRWMADFFLRFEALSNWSANMKMKMMSRDSMHYWTIRQTMHITKSATPVAALKKILQLSARNIHADTIRQDVLMLAGEEDHFIPFRRYHRQLRMLTNVRSLTDRVFTRNDHAENHCQTGNVGLALEEMVKWIEKK